MELNRLNNEQLKEFLSLMEKDIEQTAAHFLSMITPEEMKDFFKSGNIHPCVDMVMTKLFLIQQVENEMRNRDLLETYRKHTYYIDYETITPTIYEDSYEKRVQHILYMKSIGCFEPAFVERRKLVFEKRLKDIQDNHESTVNMNKSKKELS